MSDETMIEPPSIFPLVEKYLIYRVDRKDKRFTNKRLSDIEYARGLLEKIQNGTID